LSASEKLKQKKLAAKLLTEAGTSGSTSSAASTADSKPDAESVNKLTEIANKILSSTGNMDIYEMTLESIQFKVQYTIHNFMVQSQCFKFFFISPEAVLLKIFARK